MSAINLSADRKLADIAKEFVDAHIGVSQAEQTLREYMIYAALEIHRGNRELTAAALTMHRNTLDRSMDMLDIPRDFGRKREKRNHPTRTEERTPQHPHSDAQPIRGVSR
jgi:DNA-binding NtrC family response regulator